MKTRTTSLLMLGSGVMVFLGCAWLATACYQMAYVVCHVGGTETNTIPLGYPCENDVKVGTGNTRTIHTAISSPPPAPGSGRSSIYAATNGNFCLWTFSYTCMGQPASALLDSPYQRYIVDPGSAVCPAP
jgi:hypothetical protein